MLCNCLNNIYLEHIHKSLLNDEYEYSQEAKETFLDIWYSCDEIKTNYKNQNTISYWRNNIRLFEIINEDDNNRNYLDCNSNIWNMFYSRYNKLCYRDTQNVIKYVAKNILKLGEITPI